MSEKEIFEFFTKEREAVGKLRDEMNHWFVDLQIRTIEQIRDLFKQIAVLSGVILGTISVLKETPHNEPYFIFGAFLFIGLIVFIILYTRETLDKDSATLQGQKDRYISMLEEKKALLDVCLSEQFFTLEAVKTYFQKLEKTNAVKELKEEIEVLKVQREKRKNGQDPLNFAGEFVVFWFLTASGVMGISLLGFPVNILLVLLVVLFFFCITFNNTATKIIDYVSRIARFLKKKR